MRNIYRFYISLILLGAIGCTFSIHAKNPDNREEKKDTTRFFNGVWVGTDILNPIAGQMSQNFSTYELDVEAGFKGKYYPVIEAGMGMGELTTDDGTKAVNHLSPYGRIGLNYAIIRSTVGFAYIGFRVGYSKYTYDMLNLNSTSGYWNEKSATDIKDIESWARWSEYLVGIRMNVSGHLYMGWSVRYKKPMKLKENTSGNPWYIPGYGEYKNEGSATGIQFTVYYKF